MELINKVLVLSPDNYEFLNTKGWGLYKQGKYQEALLHLEAAKKSVAEQKHN